ncbi:MAG: PAS domain S-box protein [Deltaproteobacteria bacterium]|nr:PAS domain S-box protein [Deltaproteobacteria bacterium]
MASRRRPPAGRATPAPSAAPDAIDARAILECAADVIYTLDLDGRLTYLNERAYELFGYTREEGVAFLGGSFMRFVAPGAQAAAVEAIRQRTESPLHRHVFRLELVHKDGTPIAVEVHGGPLLRDGRMVGRVGVARLLDGLDRADGATADSRGAFQRERMRIARGLRDAIAQIVFGVTAERDASEAFLADVKRATQADMARRLRLDQVDLETLRLIAAGASNREIGAQVHLSPAAVKDRVRRLMDRLGARRRTELAAHALRLGIA